MVSQYMGPDIANVLQSQALTFLNNAVFRGDSRNFTFDKFIGRLRQAFKDLGPDDQCTEVRKVKELMKAWQVPDMDHLDPHVLNHPQRSINFEAAVSFLGDQLANRKVKHNPGGTRAARQLAPVELAPLGSRQPGRNGKTRFHRRGGGRNDNKHKFDPKQPHKFLRGKAWWDLTDAQREAARKARLKRGISPKASRNVSTIQVQPMEEDKKPAASPAVGHPKPRVIMMTQRFPSTEQSPRED